MRQTLRIGAALLIASITPATIFDFPYLIDRLHVYSGPDLHYAYESAFGVWLASFVVALLHAVVFGLPTYLLVNRLNLIRWWIAIICGFVIGCLPMVVISFPRSYGPGESFISDGVVLMSNSVVTTAGYLQYFYGVLSAGTLGACGAVTAWFWWWTTRGQET